MTNKELQDLLRLYPDDLPIVSLDFTDCPIQINPLLRIAHSDTAYDFGAEIKIEEYIRLIF